MTADHTIYITAAYAITAVVLVLVVVLSLRDWAKIRKKLGKTDA